MRLIIIIIIRTIIITQTQQPTDFCVREIEIVWSLGMATSAITKIKIFTMMSTFLHRTERGRIKRRTMIILIQAIPSRIKRKTMMILIQAIPSRIKRRTMIIIIQAIPSRIKRRTMIILIQAIGGQFHNEDDNSSEIFVEEEK